MTRSPWLGPALAGVLFAPFLSAQVPAGRVVVASALPGPAGGTALAVADLAGGAPVLIQSSPAQAADPLAVAIDPVDRDVIVAVRGAGNTSRIVRLHLSGLSVVGETTLAAVAGTVTSLGLGPEDRMIAVVRGTGGGLVEFDRRRPAAPVVLDAFDRGCGQEILGRQRDFAWLARCGGSGQPPEVRFVDLDSGLLTRAWLPLTGMPSPELTGFRQLPSRLPIGFVTDDSGTLSRVDLATGAATALPVTPVLPAGGTVAMREDPDDVTRAFVLGGAPHPFLMSVGPLDPAPQWVNLTGRLPGDPVDFDLAPDGVSVVFGDPCQLRLAASGGASIGNPTAVVAANAVPGPIALGIGLDDRFAGPTPLPVLLGSCPLHIDPTVFTVGVATSALGPGFSFVIPDSSSLIGAMVFGQLFQPDNTGVLRTSEAVVFHIGG